MYEAPEMYRQDKWFGPCPYPYSPVKKVGNMRSNWLQIRKTWYQGNQHNSIIEGGTYFSKGIREAFEQVALKLSWEWGGAMNCKRQDIAIEAEDPTRGKELASPRNQTEAMWLEHDAREGG